MKPITLNEKDLSRAIDLTDSGMVLDVAALACDFTTSNELTEYEFSAEDSATDYVLAHFNYENELLRRDNERGNVSGISASRRVEMHASDLLAGAWLAINEPVVFAANLDSFTEYCKEHAQEVSRGEDAPHYDDNMPYPLDLMKELTDAVADAQREVWREWLNGDRSSVGLLDTLSVKLTGARGNVEYSEDDHDLTVSFTDEQAADFWQEREGYDEDKQPTHGEVKTLVIDWLVDRAQAVSNKVSAARAAGKKERERLAAYKEEQNAARLAEIAKMKK